MTEAHRTARSASGSSQDSSAPASGDRDANSQSGGTASHQVQAFQSRRERRAFEQAQSSESARVGSARVVESVQSAESSWGSGPVASTAVAEAAASTAVADDNRHHSEPDPFAALLGLSDPHMRPSTQADVREEDSRGIRRASDASRAHRVDAVAASTQTGRVRLHADALARTTDSAPMPVVLPASGTPNEATSGSVAAADAAASVPSTRRDARATASRTFWRRGRSKQAATAAGASPLGATASGATAAGAAPAGAAPAGAGALPRKPDLRASKATPRATAKQTMSRRSRLARLISKSAIMLAAAGLVATTAVPAYAQFQSPTWVDPVTGKTQTLAVGAVPTDSLARDDFAAHTISTALDSTMGSVVAPEVQALAQQLMTAVAQGRLTGSVPDHIFEIRYLAAGKAVQGCGIDFRVLQTIAYALTKFKTVGVSDINRHCTGQIEGAGTASAHYTDGGGHAVDFDLLNGHSLTGGDSNSVKLIEALDRVVPMDATVGQMNCRSSLPLSHFQQIDDTCNHVHVDFLAAKGATLLG